MVISIVEKIVGRVYPLRRARFYLQRMVVGPSKRRKLASLLSRRLPVLPAAWGEEHLEERQILEEQGYVMLPNLVKECEVDEVVTWLKEKPVYDRWNKAAGTFSIDEPPDDCHTAPHLDTDIVNCPHLLRWANDPRVLSIVGQSLGGKPTLSNLTAWWSYPGHDEPQQAENFHRDVDDLRFIKLFVYLTDVDEECGPHVFVPGSHVCEDFTKIRRYTDEEVISYFGSKGIKSFHGERGSAFLENTFGLHKGQLPKSRRRLLFQAQYSLGPIGIYEYFPIQPEKSSGHPVLDEYVNRLYVK